MEFRASRSAKTLQERVGVNYAGSVTSDRGSWYMWLDDQRHQLCWSHLIRNVRALGERYTGLREWADAFEGLSEVMFGIWHCYRGGTMTRAELAVALEPIQAMLYALLEEGSRRSDAGAGLCKELLKHWEAMWRFVREGCFGAHSAGGNRFVERILTVAATCRQQQRDLLSFLTEAIEAAWHGRSAPRLFPSP